MGWEDGTPGRETWAPASPPPPPLCLPLWISVSSTFRRGPPPATGSPGLGQSRICVRRHQKQNRALCGRLRTDNLKGDGGRRIEAFLLWRKAWAAGREPEAADITIILGTSLWEVGGSLRECAELPGEGTEGLCLAQRHWKEACGPGSPKSKFRRKGCGSHTSAQFLGFDLGIQDGTKRWMWSSLSKNPLAGVPGPVCDLDADATFSLQPPELACRGMDL